jgi:predicted MFS family arabinose efflux permease
LFIIRRRPQDIGLLPDGDAEDTNDGESDAGRRPDDPAVEVSWSRAEAIRSSAFWRLTTIDGLRMLAMSSVGIFRIPYFIDDKGFDAAIVAWSLSVEAVFSVLVALPTGWAVDRYQPRYIAALSTLLMIASFLLTMAASSIVMVFVATSFAGLGAASFIVCQNAVWPAYFGHLHIGTIRGFATPFMLILSAIGGPATGIIRDTTGSYQMAWIVATAGLVIATLLLLVTPKPEPSPSSDARPVVSPGVSM